MPHGEAAHGDVVDPRLGGIEDRLADVDLDPAIVRVDVPELRPDRGVVRPHPGEPQRRVAGRGEDVLQAGRLGQPVLVPVDRPGVVLPSLVVEPVAADQVGIRIEVAEETVVDGDRPGVVLRSRPAPHDLRPLDHHLFTWCRLVGDALVVGAAPAGWRHPLTVGPCVHRHHVSRLRPGRRGRDRPERLLPASAVGVVPGHRDVVLASLQGRGGKRQETPRQSHRRHRPGHGHRVPRPRFTRRHHMRHFAPGGRAAIRRSSRWPASRVATRSPRGARRRARTVLRSLRKGSLTCAHRPGRGGSSRGRVLPRRRVSVGGASTGLTGAREGRAPRDLVA